jgi:hypothetical protein
MPNRRQNPQLVTPLALTKPFNSMSNSQFAFSRLFTAAQPLSPQALAPTPRTAMTTPVDKRCLSAIMLSGKRKEDEKKRVSRPPSFESLSKCAALCRTCGFAAEIAGSAGHTRAPNREKCRDRTATNRDIFTPPMPQRSEVRSQKSEVRSQKSEVGGRRSVDSFILQSSLLPALTHQNYPD